MGSENAEFQADFKFIDTGFKNVPKSYTQKNSKKCAKTKIPKIRKVV